MPPSAAGSNTDNGYTAEMWVDLTRFGYPSGLGDGVVFMGITLLDRDTHYSSPSSVATGTRTWWFREFDDIAGPALVFRDAGRPIVDVPSPPASGSSLALLGNRPNPSSRSTVVSFALGEPGEATVEVFDLSGRRVSSRPLGRLETGPHLATIETSGMKPGLYLYRLRFRSASGGMRTTSAGKLAVVQ